MDEHMKTAHAAGNPRRKRPNPLASKASGKNVQCLHCKRWVLSASRLRKHMKRQHPELLSVTSSVVNQKPFQKHRTACHNRPSLFTGGAGNIPRRAERQEGQRGRSCCVER